LLLNNSNLARLPVSTLVAILSSKVRFSLLPKPLPLSSIVPFKTLLATLLVLADMALMLWANCKVLLLPL
jgi:hypothetical protein